MDFAIPFLLMILGLIGLFLPSWLKYIFVTPIYLLFLGDYISNLILVIPFIKVVSFTAILSISITIFFIKLKWISLNNIFLTLFIFGIATTIMANYETKLYITNKAIETFGEKPYSVNIYLGSRHEINPPHATLFHDNKTYNWSFKEDDFY